MPAWVDATAEKSSANYHAGPQPATTSAYEHVIAEPVLIGMLIKQYGWISPEPGKLQRYRVK